MAAPGPPFRRMGATFLLLLLLSCNALWLRLYVTGMFCVCVCARMDGWMEGAWVLLQSRNGVSHAYTTGTGQTNFHQLPSAFSDGGLHFHAGAALINAGRGTGHGAGDRGKAGSRKHQAVVVAHVP